MVVHDSDRRRRSALVTAEAFELQAQALCCQAEALLVQAQHAERGGVPISSSLRATVATMRQSADARRGCAVRWREIAGLHGSTLPRGEA